MEQKQFTLVKMQQAETLHLERKHSQQTYNGKNKPKKLMMDSHQTICIFKTPCNDLNTNYPENIRV